MRNDASSSLCNKLERHRHVVMLNRRGGTLPRGRALASSLRRTRIRFLVDRTRPPWRRRRKRSCSSPDLSNALVQEQVLDDTTTNEEATPPFKTECTCC